MWNAITGHKKQIEQLTTAAKNGKLPSAYLFSGPRGIGKFLVAKTFACHMLCMGKNAPCGTCPICHRIMNNNHPDVHVVASDGAQIKIDQIREVSAKLQLHALEGNYKVTIIDEAERMNAAAANSALKILEEPPKNTLFILVSSNPRSLLPTIVSRCQVVSFSPLDEKLIKEHLQKIKGFGPAVADMLAILSEGSFVDLGLNEETIQNFYKDFAVIINCRQMQDLMGVAEAWAGDKEFIEGKLLLLKGCFRDALIMKGDLKKPIINLSIKNTIKELSNRYTADELITSIGEIDEVLKHMDDATNKQLMFEQLLFSLARPALDSAGHVN
jgi:DNA polymerase-3 subunit delta'